MNAVKSRDHRIECARGPLYDDAAADRNDDMEYVDITDMTLEQVARLKIAGEYGRNRAATREINRAERRRTKSAGVRLRDVPPSLPPALYPLPPAGEIETVPLGKINCDRCGGPVLQEAPDDLSALPEIDNDGMAWRAVCARCVQEHRSVQA